MTTMIHENRKGHVGRGLHGGDDDRPVASCVVVRLLHAEAGRWHRAMADRWHRTRNRNGGIAPGSDSSCGSRPVASVVEHNPSRPSGGIMPSSAFLVVVDPSPQPLIFSAAFCAVWRGLTGPLFGSASSVRFSAVWHRAGAVHCRTVRWHHAIFRVTVIVGPFATHSHGLVRILCGVAGPDLTPPQIPPLATPDQESGRRYV